MGICSSCESTATSVATAKLILQDGKLQEFSKPVKVSYVLARNPSCFICNSDAMDFDDFVSAVNDDEELQLGQLYFALPLSRLHYPLQAEEMAALAVKASSALMKSGGVLCGCRLKEEPVMDSGNSDAGFRRYEGGLQRERLNTKSSHRRKPSRGRRNTFTAELTTIEEGNDWE